MHLFTTRYFLSLGNVAFSMVLGVIALAACAIYNEQLLLGMLKQASAVREWIVSFSGAPKMEIRMKNTKVNLLILRSEREVGSISSSTNLSTILESG